jgi:hypothetical protein
MPRMRPAHFVHVVYRTRQFDKMIAWYQAVFDCRVQHQNPGLAFLTYDDGHHRVAIINLAAVLPDAGKDERRGVIGVDVVVHTYGSVEDPAPFADLASSRWITLRATCLTDASYPRALCNLQQRRQLLRCATYRNVRFEERAHAIDRVCLEFRRLAPREDRDLGVRRQ